MNIYTKIKSVIIVLASVVMCCNCYANDNSYSEARRLQREGKADEAIAMFKKYLTSVVSKDCLPEEQLKEFTDALVQMMNTYQSKGEPEACIVALQEVYSASAILQGHCKRDYYSVLGYALSRTERMQEAEETMMKALSLPLHHATPERYFRDYAYAAAVFYSNRNYQKEVIYWCEEALRKQNCAR